MAFNLVMATRATETEGFPEELREMLWRVNFSRQPEYAVYARARGPGLVDYFATVDIPERSVYGAVNYHYQAYGTSLEMAVHAVAYTAMCAIRRELPVLSEMPFRYHPIYEDGLVNNVEYPEESSPMFVQRAAGGFWAYDQERRCLVAELWETRSRLSRLL
jgi:hypothetical protein